MSIRAPSGRRKLSTVALTPAVRTLGHSNRTELHSRSGLKAGAGAPAGPMFLAQLPAGDFNRFVAAAVTLWLEFAPAWPPESTGGGPVDRTDNPAYGSILRSLADSARRTVLRDRSVAGDGLD